MFAAKSAAPLAEERILRKPVLDQAAEGGITLFTTPPGYLFAESLAAALIEQDRPILWLRVGTEDHDPATFLLSLITAAQRTRPGAGLRTLELMRQNPGPVAGWPPLFSHLARELSEELPEKSAFVLEHIHNLSNAQPVLGLIGTQILSELSNRNPCILVTQDVFPSASLPESTIIRGIDDLRIDVRSGIALAGSAETGLSGDCIRRAIELIEGRMVALAGVFTACSLLGPTFIQQAVNRSKNINHLLSLIARASLAMVDTSDLQALLLAMYLDYSHPDLVQNVLGSRETPVGPWIQPLNDHWMRVRRVWKAPLNTALHAQGGSNYSAIHKAADYLIQQGAEEQAVHLYLQIGDSTGAAKIIDRIAEKLMNLGQWETLDGWLNQLPAKILHDWPWLLYTKAEIDTAAGQLKTARRNFAIAASLFSGYHETEGACQSLLAESTLAVWDDDRNHAQACALAANAMAEAAGLNQYRGWAEWQLGCLSAASGELDNALAYFSQAGQSISDPLLDQLFHEVETVTLRQRDLKRESEFHRQAYQRAENAEQETAGQLNSLISSPPDNLSALLSVHGWSKVPLLLKVAPPEAPVTFSESNDRLTLWQGLLNTLRQYRRSKIADPAAIEDNLASRVLPISIAQQNNLGLSISSNPLSPPKHLLELLENNALPVGDKHTLDSVTQLSPLESPPPLSSEEDERMETLTAHLLGAFRVYLNDHPLEKWPGSRGPAILKYFLLHKDQEIPRDILMNVYWPDATPQAARNNLNVALHNLRNAFRAVTATPVILFDKGKGAYHLNPELRIWLDVDEFNRHFQAARKLEATGQITHALSEYEIAASVYQGDLLADDLYEEWPILTRERLRFAYLDMLDRLSHLYFSQGQYTACVTLCQLILERDNCREDAHRRLMRCYSRQGQHHLALRQYQVCVEALRSELDVDPEQATIQLYERIRRHEPI